VWLLLSQRDIVVDSEDVHGRTPLSFATAKGFSAVVEQLLAWIDMTPTDSGNMNM